MQRPPPHLSDPLRSVFQLENPGMWTGSLCWSDRLCVSLTARTYKCKVKVKHSRYISSFIHTSRLYRLISCSMAQVASRSKPLMLIEPRLRVVTWVGRVCGEVARSLRFFRCFLVYWCRGFWVAFDLVWVVCTLEDLRLKYRLLPPVRMLKH